MFTHIMLIPVRIFCGCHLIKLVNIMPLLPHIHILLCTKDGEAWIFEQLNSILNQTYRKWSLWISDDGSSDATLRIVSDVISDNPERYIRLFHGPQKGCARNFLSLLIRPELAGSWIAFADQDDIWMPHKLHRAIEMIGRGTGAQIYAGRCVYINSIGKPVGVSPLHHRSHDFGNALVQNVLRGNTLVMPPAISCYLQTVFALTRELDLPFHDWCIYLAVTGVGFVIIHDEKPGVFYRQHSTNVLGASRSNVVRRAKLIYRRHYSDWIDRNVNFLGHISPFLDESNLTLLDKFVEFRKRRGPLSSSALRRLGIYRQTRTGDYILQAMSWCGRI